MSAWETLAHDVRTIFLDGSLRFGLSGAFGSSATRMAADEEEGSEAAELSPAAGFS